MLNLFRRKKKVVAIPKQAPGDLYQGVWEKKRQPSPGAQAYAFETLGLAQFTPIGPAVAAREHINPFPGTPQPYVTKAVVLDGIAITAGQIYGQPLYDPSQGYVGNGMPVINNPFPYSPEPVGGSTL